MSTVGLAVGERLDEVTELVAEDPYKLATGGLVDMKQLNAAPQKRYVRAPVPHAVSLWPCVLTLSSLPLCASSAAVIGTEFSHETKTVDDDKHM